MAFDSLETLFQNMGPTYAASMTGSREADQSLANILNMQQTQSSTEGNQLSNLLKSRTMDSDVAKAAAAASKEQSEADLKGVESRISKATEASKTKNALTAEDIRRMEQHQDIATKAAGYITTSANPEAARQELLASGQIPQDSPVYRVLANTPASKLPDVISKYNKYVESNKADYIKEIAKQQEHNKGITDVARINADARRAVAEANKKSSDLMTDFLKLDAGKQLTNATAYLAAGVNPRTNEPLSEPEKVFLTHLRDIAKEKVNADLLAKSQQGVAPSMGPNGMEIKNKTVPSVGNTDVGTTSSGLKYRIIPN